MGGRGAGGGGKGGGGGGGGSSAARDAQIDATTKKMTDVQAEIRRNRTLASQARSVGLPTTVFNSKIKNLQSQFKNLQADMRKIIGL